MYNPFLVSILHFNLFLFGFVFIFIIFQDLRYFIFFILKFYFLYSLVFPFSVLAKFLFMYLFNETKTGIESSECRYGFNQVACASLFINNDPPCNVTSGNSLLYCFDDCVRLLGKCQSATDVASYCSVVSIFAANGTTEW
jgi:hypothetical protein